MFASCFTMAECAQPSPQQASPANPSAKSFEDELISLCRVLEQWREEVRNDPTQNEPFVLNRRAMWHSVILFASYGLAGLLFLLIDRSRYPSAYLIAYLTGIVAMVVGFSVFFVQATALGSKRFWQETLQDFSKADNYPFEMLRGNLQADFAAIEKLSSCSKHALVTVQERLNLLESQLRERVTSVIGTPHLFFFAGLAAAAFTAWQSFHTQNSTATMVVFACSLLVFPFAIYGARLRLSLVELTRCRSLIALEIARRTSS